MKTSYKITLTLFALSFMMACAEADKPKNAFVTGANKYQNEEQKKDDLDSEKIPQEPEQPVTPPADKIPDPPPDEPPPDEPPPDEPPPVEPPPVEPPPVEDPPVIESLLNLNIIGQGSVSVVPIKAKYYVGDVVQLIATPAAQWGFTGYTGAVISTQASVGYTIVSATTSITASFSQVDFTIYSEDFESYGVSQNPLYWVDTDTENANTVNNGLFHTSTVGTAKTFATSSELNNIHSHVVTSTSASWKNYRYTADLRISDALSSIGLTFFSQYDGKSTLASDTSKDIYYRLRSLKGGNFNIVPHPNGKLMTSGITDSGISPAANTWYRVIIEVWDSGTATRVKAKIWIRGTTQPSNWQIDCTDSAADRIRTGTIGVWTNGVGTKNFDNIKVEALP